MTDMPKELLLPGQGPVEPGAGSRPAEIGATHEANAEFSEARDL